MTYSSGCSPCSSGCYSSCSGLEKAVGGYHSGYATGQDVISHSVSSSTLSDSGSYGPASGGSAAGYVVDLDKKVVDFISPYRGSSVQADKAEESYTSSDKSPAQQENVKYESMITQGMLSPSRPLTQFISDAEDIREFAIEAFEKLLSAPFPDDIIINVLGEQDFKKAHARNGGREWNEGILGFAVNKKEGSSLVFVKKNHLDSIMLTLGHELGHVLTPSRDDVTDEEAKAFSFELAWAKKIIDNDIGSLAKSFDVNFRPANNGIHDRAFNFVQDKVNKGQQAIDLFWDISRGAVKVPEVEKQS